MTFGTTTGVLLTIFFLIPGFLWKKSAQLFSPYAPTKKIEILECLVLSCLNYFLAIIPIYILLSKWPSGLNLADRLSISQHPWYIAFWLGLVFALPLIGGFTVAKLSGCKRIKDSLGKLGISILHPAPSAWDYAFARGECYWARITLENGDIVEGLFDSNSLASSEPDDRDIFLENIYSYDEKKAEYKGIPRNKGVWINSSKIKMITFFSLADSPAEKINLKKNEKMI